MELSADGLILQLYVLVGRKFMFGKSCQSYGLKCSLTLTIFTHLSWSFTEIIHFDFISCMLLPFTGHIGNTKFKEELQVWK